MKSKISYKKVFFLKKYKICLLFFFFCIRILLKLINSNNKISVIIPTYNRAKLIKRTLNNILNQTYKNIEVIVVDDYSKDNTQNIVNHFNDNRIRYIKLRKNMGACMARNIGIKKAFGNYLSFLDSDDLFHFDKLEYQIKNLLKYDSDFDFCKISIHFSNKIKTIYPKKEQENMILNNNILGGLCINNFISTQSILVKKSCIEKYLFDTRFPRYQDYDLVLRMIPNIKVSYTKKVLVDLFRQNDSISSSREKLKIAKELLLKKKDKYICSKKKKVFY